MVLVKTGDRLEIYPQNSKAQGQQQPYVSQIQEVIGENQIVILAPIRKGVIVPLQLSQSYEFVFYTSKGLLGCMGQVVRRRKSNNLHFMVVQLELPFIKVQRRSFYRMDCTLPFEYQNYKGEKMKGIIKDISGGGIRFITEQKLMMEEVITFDLPLSLTQKIAARGKVLSEVTSHLELHPYEYRIKFIGMDIKMQDLIIEYIFEEERKRRSRERGL